MINEENVLRGGEQSAGGWVPSESAGALGDKRAAAALATVSLFRCFALWPVDLAGALFAVLQEGDGSVDGCRDFLRASVISQGDEKAYMHVDWLADKETDCVVEGYGKTIALADVE